MGVSVARECELMGRSRAIFYDTAPAVLEDENLLVRIGAIYDELSASATAGFGGRGATA